jgi:hypothetical protein
MDQMPYHDVVTVTILLMMHMTYLRGRGIVYYNHISSLLYWPLGSGWWVIDGERGSRFIRIMSIILRIIGRGWTTIAWRWTTIAWRWTTIARRWDLLIVKRLISRLMVCCHNKKNYLDK